MTAKHTPGPWKAEPMTDGDYRIWAEFESRGVAHVFRGRDDALLIAASPKLLYAAEELLTALGAKVPKHLQVQIDYLAEAVAEAKGEA